MRRGVVIKRNNKSGEELDWMEWWYRRGGEFWGVFVDGKENLEFCVWMVF